MASESELLSSREFFMETLQNELYRQLDDYRIEHKFNRKQLAQHLGYSKGYVTRLLAGEFNHTVQKLIDLSLKIGKAPVITFKEMEEFIQSEGRRKVISLNTLDEIVYNTEESEYEAYALSA